MSITKAVTVVLVARVAVPAVVVAGEAVAVDVAHVAAPVAARTGSQEIHVSPANLAGLFF